MEFMHNKINLKKYQNQRREKDKGNPMGVREKEQKKAQVNELLRGYKTEAKREANENESMGII